MYFRPFYHDSQEYIGYGLKGIIVEYIMSTVLITSLGQRK